MIVGYSGAPKYLKSTPVIGFPITTFFQTTSFKWNLVVTVSSQQPFCNHRNLNSYNSTFEFRSIGCDLQLTI